MNVKRNYRASLRVKAGLNSTFKKLRRSLVLLAEKWKEHILFWVPTVDGDCYELEDTCFKGKLWQPRYIKIQKTSLCQQRSALWFFQKSYMSRELDHKEGWNYSHVWLLHSWLQILHGPQATEGHSLLQGSLPTGVALLQADFLPASCTREAWLRPSKMFLLKAEDFEKFRQREDQINTEGNWPGTGLTGSLKNPDSERLRAEEGRRGEMVGTMDTNFLGKLWEKQSSGVTVMNTKLDLATEQQQLLCPSPFSGKPSISHWIYSH